MLDVRKLWMTDGKNRDPGTMEESFALMWTQWLVRYLFCTDQRCHSGDPHQSCNVNTCLAKSPARAIMGEGLVSWWCQLGKIAKVRHQHEDHHQKLSFWPNFDLSSNAGISCLAFAHSSTTKPGKSWAWRIRRSLQRWQRMRQINHCEKSWAGIWQPILLRIFHYTNGNFSRYFGWIWRNISERKWWSKNCQSLKKDLYWIQYYANWNRFFSSIGGVSMHTQVYFVLLKLEV